MLIVYRVLQRKNKIWKGNRMTSDTCDISEINEWIQKSRGQLHMPFAATLHLLLKIIYSRDFQGDYYSALQAK